MKIFLLLLFFVLAQITSGQSLDADSFTKITFQYSKEHLSFGKPGQFSISQLIKFSRKHSSLFILCSYYQVRQSYDSLSTSIVSDTTNRKASIKKTNKAAIDDLIVQLNNSEDSFTSAFVRPFLLRPAKKEIFDLANKYSLQWKFSNDYSDKADTRKSFRDIRKYL